MESIKFRGFAPNDLDNPYKKKLGDDVAIINGEKITGKWIESNGIYHSLDRKGIFLDGMKPDVANNWIQIIPETLEYHLKDYDIHRSVIFKGFSPDKKGNDKYKDPYGQVYQGKWIYGNSIHYPRNHTKNGKCFITDYQDKCNQEHEIVRQSLSLIPADPNTWEYTPMCCLCCEEAEIIQEEYDDDPLVMCGKCRSCVVGMLEDVQENNCPCIAYEDNGKNIDPNYYPY